ncbi:MAG: phosphate transport system permease protein [Acidimicrobiales bacterium]|jgi:phosphate transport system permease protein
MSSNEAASSNAVVSGSAAADASARPTLGSLRRRRSADIKGQIFLGLLLIAIGLAVAMVLSVLASVLVDGSDVLTGQLRTFLSNPSSSDPAKAGVAQGIRGSLLIAAIVSLVAFPVGIGAAIYLEEYAGDTLFTRVIEIAVRNLAGIPSIVYGLLGLAVFVQALRGLTGGSSVISGGLTLSLLVLPIVIITASEAIRAVPSSLSDGAYGLGATQWEVIRTQTLPAALPGILTGAMLSIARALGEAAPLLVVGAAAFYTTGFQGFLEQFRGAFTALPMNVANFAKLPADKWAGHAAAASVVVLVVVFFINLVAILARARITKKLGR